MAGLTPFRCIQRLVLTVLAMTLLPDTARAENGCPAGYEPWRIPVESQNDCIPIPDYQPDQPGRQPDRPAANPSWHSFAAVVVWADSPDGDRYVTVERFLVVDEGVDLELAKGKAIEKCRQNRTWTNCSVATWSVNGSIAIGRDERGRLRTRNADDPGQARNGLIERCRADRRTCAVERVIDSRAQYF